MRMILVLLSCSLLTACTSTPKSTEKKSYKCPQPLIVRDLSLQTEKDPQTNKIIARTHLDKISPSCRVEDSNKIRLRLNPQLTATRFHPQHPKAVKITYFVALVNEQGQVLNKKSFPVTIEFAESERRAYEIPNNEWSFTLDDPSILETSRIYAGLQIDHKEWASNQQRYKRKHKEFAAANIN